MLLQIQPISFVKYSTAKIKSPFSFWIYSEFDDVANKM